MTPLSIIAMGLIAWSIGGFYLTTQYDPWGWYSKAGLLWTAVVMIIGGPLWWTFELLWAWLEWRADKDDSN